MEYLKKIAGEKYLYSHEDPDGTQTYFVRKVENGKDTTECLNTKRIGTARKLRDGWVHSRTSKRLGIIEKVEEEGPVLITTILDDYEKSGYPDKQGNPKKPGDHLVSELASIVALRGFWDGKEVDALTQNNWDKYRDWRKENRVFEDDRVYDQVFRQGRLKADSRQIVLCYKVQRRLRKLANEIEQKGQNKYWFIARYD